ncbi:MAG: GNAT family N-acetyltransferase, partial [Planctomycetaceae bacterium]|nr:GNAT family N-acetyltransferase [Planctomycetaceae bacterium]
VHDNSDMEVAEVLALAVNKMDRREGIGRQLLNRVVRLPRKEIIAHVDEQNLETQLFLRSAGFRAVAIEPGTPDYYVFKRSGTEVASSVTEVKKPQTAGVLS